ncbi:hypothetical protein MMC11_004537 [Xylographa trunciseda]|nr:hypothetical protein [Xylographa trunciseda]
MDAVSAASAVLGIVGFGLQVYQTLFTFVSKAADADQCVQALMIDINLTVSALREVHDLLEKEENLEETRKGRRLFSDDGLVDTKRTAEQCMTIFKSIVAFILKHSRKGRNEVSTKERDPNYLRIHRAEVVSKLESIKWALVQDKVNLFTARLGTFKLSLLLILSVTSLKAQHQNLNDYDIVTDRDLQADILYIRNLEKARKEAKDKWTLLRASILQKSQSVDKTSQGPLPIHDEVHRPAQAAIIEEELFPDPQLPSETVTGQGGSLPTYGEDGAVEIPLQPESSTVRSEVDTETPMPHGSVAKGLKSDGYQQDITVQPEMGPTNVPITGLETKLDSMPVMDPMKGRGTPLSVLSSSQKGSETRIHQSTSSNNNDKTHPVLKYKWTSLDAYLWKDDMIRKLTYTEAHINELARHILRQSPDRWWKLFSSLSSEEHTGLEEAMDERRPDEARFLLGIQILSARYAHFLHSMLRLVSLGMLDRREIETRALLIIIGNKAADDLADIESGEVSPAVRRRAERKRDRGPKVLSLSRPTYVKVNKKYLDTETLDLYGLPWEWDARNTDFIIIKQWVPQHDQDILFEHTRKRREKPELTIGKDLGKHRDQNVLARKKEPKSADAVRIDLFSGEGAHVNGLETPLDEENFVEVGRHRKDSAKSARPDARQPYVSTTGEDLYSSDLCPPLASTLPRRPSTTARFGSFQPQSKRAKANRIITQSDPRPPVFERRHYQEEHLPVTVTYFTDDDENDRSRMRSQGRLQARERPSVPQSSNARRAPREHPRKPADNRSQDDDVVSVSDVSLYASPASENDEIDAAETRVQELLSRWTAPALTEDTRGGNEQYIGDTDGPTVEEGEYLE